jgi:transcription elongation factor SPT6
MSFKILKFTCSVLKCIVCHFRNKRPHCILVGTADRTATHVKEDVDNVVSDLINGDSQFPKIKVTYMNDNLSRVFANSQRAEADMREYPNVLRQAISMARRMQDPIVEFSQLAGKKKLKKFEKI